MCRLSQKLLFWVEAAPLSRTVLINYWQLYMFLYVQYVIPQGINTIWLQQRTNDLQAMKM